MRALLVSLPLLLAASLADAQTVYKFVDKHGNLVFSDTPVAGAEAVEVQPASTIKMAPVTLPPTQAPSPAVRSYESVSITTPSNETVFSNEPEPIILTGVSSPGLMAGDKYRFTINGQATAPLTSPHYSFNSEERGSFTAVLQIVDSNLHVKAESSPVTFHVKRHSKLFKKPTAPGPIKR